MAKGFEVFLGILASKNTAINIHYARIFANNFLTTDYTDFYGLRLAQVSRPETVRYCIPFLVFHFLTKLRRGAKILPQITLIFTE